MYRKVVCIGGSVALILIAIVGALRVASAFGDHPDLSTGQNCDRACLDGSVDSYLDALAAGDPSRLPLTPTVKSAEDGQRLAAPPRQSTTLVRPGTSTLPWNDIAAFGAKCDGITDDTLAIKNAVTDALRSGGIVYIPRSAQMCVTSLSAFSNTTNNQTWLYVLDDNSLIINGGFITGQRVAIVGRAGPFRSRSGTFDVGPHITWHASSNSVSPLAIQALTSARFEGIGFAQTDAATVPTAFAITRASDGAGSVNVSFVNDQFIAHCGSTNPAFEATVDGSHPASPSGFGWFFSGDAFDCDSTGNFAAIFVNTGQISIDGPIWSSFIGAGIELVRNARVAAATGDIHIQNVLLESFGPGGDFITSVNNGSGSSPFAVTLNNVQNADASGVNLFKHTGGGMSGLSMSAIQGFAALIDPTSATREIEGVSCINSFGCNAASSSAAISGGIFLDSGFGGGSPTPLAIYNHYRTYAPLSIGQDSSHAAQLDTSLLTGVRDIKYPDLSGTLYATGGTTFRASGCSNSTLVGGATAGSFASGITGTCTVTITMGSSQAATHAWTCWASDLTAPARRISQTIGGTAATQAVLTGTTVSGDVINFGCIPY